MQITDPLSNPQLIIEKVKSEVLQKIHAGGTHRATVTAAPRNGVVQLNIEGQSLLAKTNLQVNTGQSLTVNVVKAGVDLQLAVVTPQNINALKADTLRTLMPKQAPVQQLVNTLRLLTGSPVNSQPPTTNLAQASSASANPPQWSGIGQQGTQILSQILAQGKLSNTTFAGNDKGNLNPNNLLKTVATMIEMASKERPAAPSNTVAMIKTPGQMDKSIDRLLASLPSPLKQALPNFQSPISANKNAPLPSREVVLLATALTEALKADGNTRSIQLQGLEKRLAQQISSVLSHGGTDKTPITADRLKQALNQSGLLLESNLAQGQPTTVDMKSSLLRLLFLLKPLATHFPASTTPEQTQNQANQNNSPTGGTGLLLRLVAELLSQTDSALARIQLNQLASAPQDDSPRQVWQFELPINHASNTENIGIQIYRDESNKEGNGSAAWSVKLRFNIEPAGPIKAHLILVGKEISSHFLAVNATSAETIERLLPKLTDAFIAAGLEVGKLTARQGDINDELPDYQPGFPILDERA